jgi:predicted glycogen debranching enzyme
VGAEIGAGLISLGADVCASRAALKREWLETDASGAYASSSLLCANTRRYHGLLVAPVAEGGQPLGRHVFLSWVEEWVEHWLEEWAADWFVKADEAPERGSYLSCAVFGDGGLRPGPLVGFERGAISTFHYAVGGLRLRKEIFCPRGTRCVAVRYTASGRCRLQLRPFFACRHFHALTRRNPQADLTSKQEGIWQVVRPYPELPPVYLAASGHISPDPGWYLRFHYPEEAARGFEAEEDLLSPAAIRLELEADRPAWLVAGLERLSPEEAAAAYEAELARRSALTGGRPQLEAQLALAADQFLIEQPGGLSVVAGYHWFEEWGRDLLVSLPGLLLVDGRIKEAVAALAAFGRHLKGGLLPNRLLAGADYASADSPLLYLLACQRVADCGGGYGLLRPLWPIVAAIIEAYHRGTAYGIVIAPDGLPLQGAPGLALTWMDARVRDAPVTPREGKAVELAALWHNGLQFAAALAEDLGLSVRAASYRAASRACARSFNRAFWNEERGCCYDVITKDGAEAAVRPNQLFAAGLPHALLSGEPAARMLDTVERHLLTPYGLRTLAPGEPGYAPRYAGGQEARDSAYHQGTVWPWLMGIYVEAVLKVRGKGAGKELRERITAPLAEHLREAGVGSVSEVFDAEAPQAAGGCIAQAWSVAELRRALFLLEGS